jgi:hypothetical protein
MMSSVSLKLFLFDGGEQVCQREEKRDGCSNNEKNAKEGTISR